MPTAPAGETHPDGEPGRVARSTGRLVFTGQPTAFLDPKKRLTIPSRWRPDGRLNELAIVKSPTRRCLNAMPQEVLEAIGAKAEAVAGSHLRHQRAKDFLFASSVVCPIDSQGRMVLPDDFCRYAGLEKEVVLAGGDEKFDIWNPEGWQEYLQSITPDGSNILTLLGL
jgi:MraZ protein